ncbi:MAG: hypothetical protein WC635_11230 [Bacteriovorax sp.]|jgi:hypothetical protein
MYKYLFALALVSGSFASYADMYNDDSTAVDNSSREYYEDTASTYNSSTMREENVEQPGMDSRVTGTMPDLSREGLTAQKWHAGVLTGVNAPSSDQVDSSPAFGIDVGYQPVEHFGAGLEAFTAEQDDANSFQRTTGLFKGTYHLGGDIPVINTTYIGAGVGPIFINDKVRWAGAPMAGFDVPLTTRTSDFLSLGLNAKYIFTTDEADAPREFASAVALKYWF